VLERTRIAPDERNIRKSMMILLCLFETSQRVRMRHSGDMLETLERWSGVARSPENRKAPELITPELRLASIVRAGAELLRF